MTGKTSSSKLQKKKKKTVPMSKCNLVNVCVYTIQENDDLVCQIHFLYHFSQSSVKII